MRKLGSVMKKARKKVAKNTESSAHFSSHLSNGSEGYHFFGICYILCSCAFAM